MSTQFSIEQASRRPTGTRIVGARRRRIAPARASGSLLERIQQLQRERGAARRPEIARLSAIYAAPARLETPRRHGP